MSSFIHTLEIFPSLSGTLKCLEKCLDSIAMTVRDVSTECSVSSVNRYMIVATPASRLQEIAISVSGGAGHVWLQVIRLEL